MPAQEIYLPTASETDSPIPRRHAMLSFAYATLTPGKRFLSAFSANLTLLPSAQPDPRIRGIPVPKPRPVGPLARRQARHLLARHPV